MTGPNRIPRLPGRATLTAFCVAVLVLALAAPVAAQELGSQTLGRGYWHMFAAYAIAWVVVFGWAVSIGRRLAEVERRIEE